MYILFVCVVWMTKDSYFFMWFIQRNNSNIVFKVSNDYCKIILTVNLLEYVSSNELGSNLMESKHMFRHELPKESLKWRIYDDWKWFFTTLLLNFRLNDVELY